MQTDSDKMVARTVCGRREFFVRQSMPPVARLDHPGDVFRRDAPLQVEEAVEIKEPLFFFGEHQAKISFTTLPCTSVRRKSRPE